MQKRIPQNVNKFLFQWDAAELILFLCWKKIYCSGFFSYPIFLKEKSPGKLLLAFMFETLYIIFLK